MFLDKVQVKPKFIVFLALGCITLSSWPKNVLKADIITDIEDLETDKEPQKKPEKKKEKEKPKASQPSETANPPASSASGKAKPTSPVMENPDPEKQAVIPEPLPDLAPPAKGPASPKGPKGKTKEQRTKAPIHWQSDGTTTYSQDRSTVTLSKNVMITQDDLRLQSQEAKVTFLPKTSAESGVKNAVLDGKVDIARYSEDPSERMKAKSDRATFDNVQQIVTLDGNARLWRANDLVRGERIIYDLTNGTIKIDKAQGVVQPDRTKK